MIFGLLKALKYKTVWFKITSMKSWFLIFSSLILMISLLILQPACGRTRQEDGSFPLEISQNDKPPKIIPYLDSRPSPRDGQGTAEVSPNGPFTASTVVDFELCFTVGKDGIAPGGYVILQISPWWGWSPPQDTHAKAEGFISVSTSVAEPPLKVNILSMHRVLVFSHERSIKAGETLTFKYSRARVDRFAEARELFMIFVDGDGDGHSACIARPPVVQILPRSPVRLVVNAPSQARPGQTLKISAAPLDLLGNWSSFPAGSFTLTVNHGETTTTAGHITSIGKEKTLAFDFAPQEEGIYFFHINGPEGLAGKSNVTLCQAGIPRLKLYFGDIHGHSRLSDGTGTPADYYDYAREVSHLDIAALTDHADYGLIPLKGSAWQLVKDISNKMYVPGEFVTFLGFEWTHWTYGHRNVYYRDGNGPIFPSIDKATDTPQKLWAGLASYEAMTIAHHVGGGPVPVDWSIPPGPVEGLVEICSIHGSSEYYGCEAGIYRPREGHFVHDALQRGYRLGIMASGDTHDGHPGQRSHNAPVSGIMGVYAPELTREAIWEALKKRRVYGTSGAKIILNFRVSDSPMGSEVNWASSRGPLPIACRAVCSEAIQQVEILRNGEPIFVETGDKINGVFAMYMIEDPAPLPGVSWYYVRVIQEDGHMAWSSPVWVTFPTPDL